MFEAINNYIVVRQQNQKTTDAGIIIAAPAEHAVIELEVVETTQVTKALQGKIIYAHRRNVHEMRDIDGFKYAAMKYEDVLAVKSVV